MAGATVGTNDSLVLRLRQHVLDAAITLGPIVFFKAMHQTYIDVIHPEFPAETVEVGTSFLGIACPRFGEHSNLVAGDMLDCFRHVRMAAIGIGAVEEAEPLVVS